MQVIPRDQMSTFPSYWPSSIAKITSGAILKFNKQISDKYVTGHSVQGLKYGRILFIFSFWHIPVWCPNKGVGRTGNGGWTKICQFYLPWLRQQDVSCLDISVKHIKGNYYNTIQRAERLETQALDAQHAPKGLKHSPVNHVVGVKVSQPLKSTMSNCSYFNFLQRSLVNWRGETIHQPWFQTRKI